MNDLLTVVPQGATIVFAAASMLAVGMRFSVKRILRPLRNIHGSIRALAANFVVVPLLAFGIGILLGLSTPDRVGLFLLGTGAGSPFLLKLAAGAKADIAQTTSLLVLLLVGTILYMPLVLPFAFQSARFSTYAIALPLTLNMFVPLAAGFALRRSAPRVAKRLAPLMGKIASASLVVLIGGTVIVNFKEVVGLVGSTAFVGVLLFVSGAFFFGWWMAPSELTEPVFGLGTGQRNVAAAAVVAEESFRVAEIAVMVVIGAVLGFIFLFPAAFQLRKRADRRQERFAAAQTLRPIDQQLVEPTFQPPPQTRTNHFGDRPS